MFFVVFISLAITFIVFSLKQSNDLVSDDYYEKGANYTRQMEINQRSVIYSDSIKLENRNNLITFRFSKSVDMMADTMTVDFFRPSDKHFDHQIIFSLNSDSLSVRNDFLHKGRYKVMFHWKHNKEIFLIEKEFFAE